MMHLAHAGRRQATADQTLSDQPHLSFGVLYQEDDLIAVIDDQHQAELGARALLDAGVPGDQIDVLGGRYFAGLLATAKRRRGPLARLGACLSRIFSDDAGYEQTLLDEARQNHALLIAHAADAAMATRISGILRAFGAHAIRYYRPAFIEDLG